VDAAGDRLVDGMVRILEGEDLTAVGVHHHLPDRFVRRPLEKERPYQAVLVSRAHGAGEPLAALQLLRRYRYDLQGWRAADLVHGRTAAGVSEPRRERRGAVDLRHRAPTADVTPGLGADEDQVAVADRGRQPAVAHGNPHVRLRDADLPQVGRHLHGPGRAQLRGVDTQERLVVPDEAPRR